MKKVLAALSLVLSLSAFAGQESVSFSYSGIEGWGQSYYSCDYAEARTEKVLAMFGATNASVRCSGGIQAGTWWGPVMVRATFEAPELMGNEVAETVKYRGEISNSSCGLNVAIVKNLLPKFSNVTVVKKSDSCAFSSSNYSYIFSILR